MTVSGLAFHAVVGGSCVIGAGKSDAYDPSASCDSESVCEGCCSLVLPTGEINLLDSRLKIEQMSSITSSSGSKMTPPEASVNDARSGSSVRSRVSLAQSSCGYR